MPNDKRKLWHLLSLLAQLHQRCLSPIPIHELSDPSKHLPILFAERTIPILTTVCCRNDRTRWICVVIYSEAIIVLLLLLSSSGRGRGSLCLGMLLRSETWVLLGVVGSLLLLMKPGGLLLVLMLMREDVL
jgi:hypothetical protein